MKRSRLLACGLIGLGLFVFAASPANAQSCNIAVWADGGTDSGGNNVDQWIESFGCTATFVSNADLDTPGFLDSFDAIFVTRQRCAFGSSLDADGALNVRAYVFGNGAPGRVVLFLNDWLDDNPFNSVSGDPADPHTSIVMKNAVKVAAASGHGYVGELNGASMALHSNLDGYIALGLIPGDATTPNDTSIPCDAVTQVGPHGHIGVGDFQPLTKTCFGTGTTGIGTNHIVYEYSSGEPAVVDNYPLRVGDARVLQAPFTLQVPAPSTHVVEPERKGSGRLSPN